MVPAGILEQFGLDSSGYRIGKTGSGHINFTFLAEGPSRFILQRINTNVFRQPDIIADRKSTRLNSSHT